MIRREKAVIIIVLSVICVSAIVLFLLLRYNAPARESCSNETGICIPARGSCSNETGICNSKAGVVYEQAIVDQLQNQTTIRVFVGIKADPNWNINKTVDEITNETKKLEDRVVPFLPASDFMNIDESDASPSFYVTVTKRGFNSLINNSQIESVGTIGMTYSSLKESAPLINASYS